MKIILDDFKREIFLQEYEVVLYLAEMINSLCDRKQFRHQEETTLKFCHEPPQLSHDRFCSIKDPKFFTTTRDSLWLLHTSKGSFSVIPPVF